MTAATADWNERVRRIEADLVPESPNGSGRELRPHGRIRHEHEPPQFNSLPWDAFRDAEEDELEWLVEDVIPEGALGFMASAPKRGKTWLAIDLSVGVATGTNWLGHTVTAPKAVLYVGLEGTRRALRARIGCLTRGRGIVPEDDGALENLRVSTRREVPELDLMRPEWWRALHSEIDEHGARLVIVDVLRSAAPRLRETGEGAVDFGRIRAGAAQLQEHGVAVVLLHHFIKAAGVDRLVGERMTGSGALYGALDVGVFITPSELGEHWDREIPVRFEARDFEPPPPAVVRIDGDGSATNGSLGFRDSAQLVVLSADQLTDKIERRVLDVLKAYTDHDGRASTTGVRQRVGMNQEVVRQTLRQLDAKGLIEHGEGGIPGLPKNTKWWRLKTSSEGGAGVDEARDQLEASSLVPPLGGDEG